MRVPVQAKPISRDFKKSMVNVNLIIPQACSTWDWVKCGTTVATCAAACIDTAGLACVTCMGSAYNSCKDCL